MKKWATNLSHKFWHLNYFVSEGTIIKYNVYQCKATHSLPPNMIDESAAMFLILITIVDNIVIRECVIKGLKILYNYHLNYFIGFPLFYLLFMFDLCTQVAF